MKRIVVPEYLPAEHLDHLRKAFDVTYDPDMYADRSVLFAHVARADAVIIRNRTRIDADLLKVAERLKVVGRLGVGLDNIDMAACKEGSVTVIPATGANAVSVAEYVIGMMLDLTRGVSGMTPAMVAGEWPRQGTPFGRELMGKTLGLIGLGTIARLVASRAAALEMAIVAHDPFVPDDDPAWSGVERKGFEELLAVADVVSVHAPLSEQTRKLFDWSAFEKMKPTAILINTSRGGIVDEVALARALHRGVIGGAALDVFEAEPLGPQRGSKFAGIDNLRLTPHIAGNTAESVDRVARLIVDAVSDELSR